MTRNGSNAEETRDLDNQGAERVDLDKWMGSDIPLLPSIMPTHDDLSSIPPAILRAALAASERREEKGKEKEKERLRREIRKLQKQLDELEECGDTSDAYVEVGKNIASGSQRKAKRPRSDSPSDDEFAKEIHGGRWPTAKVRKVDPLPVLPQRYVHSGDGTLVMTQDLQSILYKMSEEGSSLRVG